MEKSHHQLHKDYLDILRGYSQIGLSDKNYYFRHFSIEQGLDMDAFLEADIKKSVRAGVKTEEVLLREAMESGFWSQKKEDQIKSLEWMIKKSTTALAKMQDIKQREIFYGQIESQRKELEEINKERKRIVGYSAETLAETKKVTRMLEESLFCDPLFEEPVEEEVRYILAPSMFSLYSSFTNRDHLLKCSYYSGFLDMYSVQSKNPLALFGVILRDLTIFQRSLLIVSSGLLSKMRNVRIPDEIAGDPIKIYEYEEKQDGEKTVSHGIDDLKAKSKVRGGKLKPEDFLSG